MLKKYLNHGFEDIVQLGIFLNGLRSDTKMLLDVAVGGTMMALDVEQATRTIDALSSTDYQAQHDRQGIQKKRLLENALLCQNKILTQQIEQLTTQMAKLPQQLHVVHSSQSQSHPIRCDFCGGDHPNGHCSYQNNSPEAKVNYMGNQGREGGFFNNQGPFQQQQQPLYPSDTARLNKLEDTVEKFIKVIMASQKNNMATIRNIEIQMGQMTKQIAERQSGQFSVNAQTNPKE